MGTSRSRAADAALWAACAAGAGAPWVLAPGLRDAWTLPKAAFVAACGTAGLAAWARAGAPSVALGLEAPALAFASCVVAAALLSQDPAVAWFGPDQIPSVGAAGAMGALASLYLGAAAARLHRGAAAALASAAALSAAAAGALAVLQALALGEGGWLGRGPASLDRGVGAFGHPVALGAYLAVALPSALAWLVGARSASARVAAGFCCAATAAGLAAAGGRASWLAAGAGCLVVLALEGSRGARRAAAGVAALALIGALALSLRLSAAGQRPGGRLGAWRIAMEASWERPWLGWGPGAFPYLYKRDRDVDLAASEGSPTVVFGHAHNDWLELLVAAGALGAAAYAWLHAAVWGAAARVRSAAAAAGLGGAAAWFVQAKFNIPTEPATALAALGFGMAASAAPAPVSAFARRAAGALFAGGTLASAALLLSLLPAERSSHLGRLAWGRGLPRAAAPHFERAVAASPGVVAFRLDLLNLLWNAAEGTSGPERGRLLLRARDVALEGAVRRPAESEFLRLLGVAELRRAESGADSLPAARAALEAARALDPFNPRTLGALAQATALQGARGRP